MIYFPPFSAATKKQLVCDRFFFQNCEVGASLEED
jgi:hypothetical protein